MRLLAAAEESEEERWTPALSPTPPTVVSLRIAEVRRLVEATEEERWHEPSLPPTTVTLTVVSLLIVEVRLLLVAREGFRRRRVAELEDLKALGLQT
jgi:hypothetical protein